MLLEKLWAVSEDASVEQIRMLSSFCHRMGVTGSLIFLAPPNTSRLCSIWFFFWFCFCSCFFFFLFPTLLSKKWSFKFKKRMDSIVSSLRSDWGEWILCRFIEGSVLNLKDVTLSAFLYYWSLSLRRGVEITPGETGNYCRIWSINVRIKEGYQTMKSTKLEER